jgi:uncharacterized protein YggE
MFKRYLISVIAISFLIPFKLVSAADISLPNQPHIIVNGYGYIDQIPDKLSIHFDISATADSFAKAKQEVDIIVAKAISAARKNGIKKEHVNASKINAYPQYEWKNQQRKYTGEQVSRQVKLTLTNAKRYNDLVDDLLSAGITRLQPVQLDFSQLETLKSKALLLALDNAKKKANTMASHLGTSVKQVFRISEQNNQQPVTRLAMSARSEMADQTRAAPLSLGKQKIEQYVQVIFLLGNPSKEQ